FILAMFILAITFVLGACSGDGDKKDPGKSDNNGKQTENGGDKTTGGTLKFAFNAQPPMLDPTGTTATATRDVVRNIFEQLVTFDDEMTVQPMLAESYEV